MINRQFKWFEKSAQQGNAFAQCNLGLAYYEGKGVDKKDDKKSVEWWEKSANQGNAVAQCNLGGMYYNGEGVDEKNVPKGIPVVYKICSTRAILKLSFT